MHDIGKLPVIGSKSIEIMGINAFIEVLPRYNNIDRYL